MCTKGAGAKGWWDDYADATPRDYATYIELENEACALRTFAPQTVTGLLQTEEYAQRVIASALLISPPREVNRRVKVRMERQERLIRNSGRSFSIALDEAVLHRRVGGPQVMRGQLEYLLEAAQRDDPDPANWRKPSYSGDGPTCVEVGEIAGGRAVRDSTQPGLGYLTFDSQEWSTLVFSLSAGGPAKLV